MPKIEIDDAEIAALFEGPVYDYIWKLGGNVVIRALDHASGRPGPNIITGDLLRGIHRERSEEGGVTCVDIGSSARHGGHDYPSDLELGYALGARFIHYPWLLPAFIDVFGADVKT